MDDNLMDRRIDKWKDDKLMDGRALVLKMGLLVNFDTRRSDREVKKSSTVCVHGRCLYCQARGNVFKGTIAAWKVCDSSIYEYLAIHLECAF